VGDSLSRCASGAAAFGRRLAVREIPAGLLFALLPTFLGPLPGSARADSAVQAATGSDFVYRAADPSAPPVTRANLLENERFWPYQVQMVRAPAGGSAGGTGGKGPPLGPKGVLVRIQAGGTARIDFGRDGIYEVPVEDTDIVARANAVRLGQIEKFGPNFVLAIGPRLVDPRTGAPQKLSEVARYATFLCVFADPSSEALPEIARALAPFRNREGVLTLFVPLGRPDDEGVRRRLDGLDWPVSRVFSWLAEPYAASLLSDGVRAPAVQLQTAEGRLIFESPWNDEAARGIAVALPGDGA